MDALDSYRHLEVAQECVKGINKRDLAEIRAYAQPPKLIATVMAAVAIFLGRDPNWASCKKLLADKNMIQMLLNFDRENISPETIQKVQEYVKQPQFNPQDVKR